MSLKALPEKTQTLDLLGKYFKSIVLNMPKDLKETMAKEPKEIRKMMRGKNQDKKDREILESNKIKIWELNNTVSETKHLLEGLTADLSRQKSQCI